MCNEKIIDRIKKLLSLSKSSNEHEAAQAAGRAADLMLKHEIAEAELAVGGEGEEAVDLTEVDKSGRVVHWRGSIMGGLADGLGCTFYYHRKRVPGGWKTFVTYNVVGQPTKVETITYMYQYLVGEVDRLADSGYRSEHHECTRSGVPAPSARAWKNAFRLGAAGVIAKRLRAQRKETHDAAHLSGASVGLVAVERATKAVEVYMASNVGRLGKTAGPQHSSRSGYGAGASAGASVGLGGAARGGLGSGARQLGSGGGN